MVLSLKSRRSLNVLPENQIIATAISVAVGLVHFAVFVTLYFLYLAFAVYEFMCIVFCQCRVARLLLHLTSIIGNLT